MRQVHFLTGMLVAIGFSALADYADIRNALDAVRRDVRPRMIDSFTAGEIGGQRIGRLPSYQNLSRLVSNEWNNVLASLGTIATNSAERCMILGAGFQFGWDFHLPFFTKIADECIAGSISSNEVAWFEAYSTKPGLVDQLYIRNSDPAVTNLLWKMIRIDGQTNHWTSIMSEGALQLLEDARTSGSLYIPE